MSSSYRVAFLSDSHLGYAAGRKIHTRSGLNCRVVDGYRAFRETIDQIIEAKPDLVVHGGDIFHVSAPDVLSIRHAQDQLTRLAHAGIPTFILIGNHDAPGERGKGAGPLVLHDPSRGIHVVQTQTEVLRPADGLAIHALTHIGLASAQRPDLRPLDGHVNLFTAHGAAAIPGSPVFHCSHSPNEQPIGLDLLTAGWDFTALGHYHGRGPLPGYPNVWYAGSSIPRGFSDPAGERGWLEITLDSSGAPTVTTHDVTQRPVIDLPRFDASGLTAAEIEEEIRASLDTVEVADAIIRQVVLNVPPATGRSVDQAALARLTAEALQWRLDLRRPEVEALPAQRHAPTTRATLADLPEQFGSFVGHHGDELVPEPIRDAVIDDGQRHLRAAAPRVEDTDGLIDDAPAEAAA